MSDAPDLPYGDWWDDFDPEAPEEETEDVQLPDWSPGDDEREWSPEDEDDRPDEPLVLV